MGAEFIYTTSRFSAMQTIWQRLPFLRKALPSEVPPDPQEYGLVLLHDDTIEDGKVLLESSCILVE